jgi:hypothetical protein
MQSKLWVFEILLGLYTLGTFAWYVLHVHRGISLFMLVYAIGLLVTGWISRPRATRRASVPSTTLSASEPDIPPDAVAAP